MNLTGWAWLLLPLGVCRAVQIVLWDRITQGPRGWLLRKLNRHGYAMRDPRRGYLAYLLECPWCMSIWVAAIAVGFTAWPTTRNATLLVLLVLALSLVAVGIDHAYDRWLPDEPLPAPPATDDRPPSHVTDAFETLTGDDTAGRS